MSSPSKNENALSPLPLDEAWPEILSGLGAHRNLVLVAEPGAGKTTRFPPRLLTSGLLTPNHNILMLEPRRLAARASAFRIAEEQGWSVGNEVGYQVRFENRTSTQTRLQILTEGLLAKRMQRDPALRETGAVILDEFHERGIHTDLALGLLYELQQLDRPDLRIIVMSATLDAPRVAEFLGDCPIVRVPGRAHPVEIHHSKSPLHMDTGPEFINTVARSALQIISQAPPSSGDVLVFLPGAREIRAVRDRISTQAESSGYSCFELHGGLSLADQNQAIRKLEGRSKIILSTNIAETSLTIDGVSTVIDSGLARVLSLDALGFPRLQLTKISFASATQRAGRAGRQGPGQCFRLWNKLDESSMAAFDTPEIMRTDLADALLTLVSYGIKDPEGFSWFETPPLESLRRGMTLLNDLGYSTPDGKLTSLGKEATKLPLDVRLSRLMLEAIRCDAAEAGSKVAALLAERDILKDLRQAKSLSRGESDALLRLHLLDDFGNWSDTISRIADPSAARNAKRVAEAIQVAARRVDCKLLGESLPQLRNLKDEDFLLRALVLAFPDRICRRRRPGDPNARIVGGKGVRLAPFSTVETADLFVALGSGEASTSPGRQDTQITVASRVERDWLRDFFSDSISTTSQVLWDDDSRSVLSQTALCFHDLPLEPPRIARPKNEEAFAVLLKYALDHRQMVVASNEGLRSLLDRLSFLRRELPPDELKTFDDESAMRSLLEVASFGETRFENVISKPLGEILLQYLDVDILRLLNDAAPEKLTVPSGSRIRIQYPKERAPYVEVRIQEIFGMSDTPRLARGRIPLSFHLLGPNFRPVQVTSDLKSFWKNGYQEVRKGLRSRYPKHSWPEDPTTAKPEAKGRRRQS